MRLSLLTLTFTCLISATAGAQQLHIQKTLFIGGDSVSVYVSFAIPTRDNGIAFVGQAEQGGKGDIPPPLHAQGEVMIGKLDSNLSLKWVKLYGSSGQDGANGICQTSDGGYMVAASNLFTDGDVPSPSRQGDFWLIRLDSNGNKLWSRCYGGVGEEQALSIAETPEHGFVVSGYVLGQQPNGDVPFTYSTSPFASDWYVLKVDSLGNKMWARVYGGTGDEEGGYITVGPGGYYLAGASDSRDHDCTDASWYTGTLTNYRLGWLLKLDTAGNVVWNRSFGGSKDVQIYQVMFDDRDSSLVLAGLSISNDYRAPGNHGVEDIYLAKFSSSGDFKWGHQYGSHWSEYGYGVCKGPDNGYLAYGNTSATTNTNPLPGAIGKEDLWLSEVDSTGGEIEHQILGGLEVDFAVQGIFPFREGFILAGGTNSSGFTEGMNVNHHPHSYSEIFLSYLNYKASGISGSTVAKAPLLKVYPNPSTASLVVEVPQNSGGKLIIIDMVGKSIYQQIVRAGSSSISIPVSGWPKGVFVMQWIGAMGGRSSARVTIQ